MSMKRAQHERSRNDPEEENEYDLPDLSDSGSESSKFSKMISANASSKKTKNKCKCKKRYILASIFCIFICIISGFAVTLVLQQIPPDDPGE